MFIVAAMSLVLFYHLLLFCSHVTNKDLFQMKVEKKEREVTARQEAEANTGTRSIRKSKVIIFKLI